MPITILHLSDIQYGRHNVDKDAKRPPLYNSDDYSPQLEKLKADLNILKKQDVRPDCIVVTGDIAEWSLKTEYAQAEAFLGGLVRHFGIDRRDVVMVPGNHDINRKLCQAARLTQEAEGEEFNPPYYPKFKFYEAFFNDFYETAKFPSNVRPYRFGEDSLFVNFYFPEKKIVFVGLNSCIDESEQEPHYGNITIEQLQMTCAELNAVDPDREMIRVAVMHHNFVRSSHEDQENLRDADELKPLLLDQGFSLILHGHQHQARQEVTGAGERVIHVLATGSAGLDGETIPEMARRYQIIRIDAPRVRVYRRCFDEYQTHVTGKGCWKPDLSADASGIYDEFVLAGMPETHAAPSRPEKAILASHAEIPEAYAKWIALKCSRMDIAELRSRGRVINVALPEIFIPLQAHPPGERKPSADSAGIRLAERSEDIEALIDRHACLLVEGQAGSGKTTLLKHVCHEVVTAGKTDSLPVLIFLRDLQPLVEEFDGLPATAASAERILDRYFVHADCGLTMAVLHAFLDAGKHVVLLLDGLDEIEARLRDLVAESMAHLRDRHENIVLALTGRPNGLTGRVVDFFGDRHVRILPLAQQQVETFVHKWFCAVGEAEENACLRTADDLISEMRAHPDVNDLKDTPLMLTAICMLYYDGGRLPGQRAELYDKFIRCLLHRRFPGDDDQVRVHQFLTALALDMHRRKERTAERIPTVKLLSSVWGGPGGNWEWERKFEWIEANCGLMLNENNRFVFWHLSLQAFLAARGLMSGEDKTPSDAIRAYWDDDWFHEMIALFIGHQAATGNDGIANGIIRRVIADPDKNPFSGWRVAARALSDIHRQLRKPEVVDATTKRLLEVMAADAKPKIRAEAGEILGRLGDPRDLKVFVPVEGGRYKLSLGETDIQPFEIGKYPVTNGWYKEFIDAGGYAQMDYWTPEGRKWLEYKNVTLPALWYDRDWNCPNAPVVGVSWYEAVAFLRWLNENLNDGHRYFLPDENQWEAAAAGQEGREYPWGDWTEKRCNSEESEIKKISAAGIFSNGDTPEGVSDMAGNVWEWTTSNYHIKETFTDFAFQEDMEELWEQWRRAEGDEKKEIEKRLIDKLEERDRPLPVLRGGSWGTDRNYARCAYRFRYFPDNRNYNAGFRCART